MRYSTFILLLVVGCESKHIYVSNEDSDDVSILDAETFKLVGTIPVGKRPRGLRVSPDGHFLLVAVSGSGKRGPGIIASTLPDRSADGIAVVDIETRKVVRRFKSGNDPEAFDLSPNGERLYVSNEDTAQLSVIDLVSGAIVGCVPVGGDPEGVAVRPDGGVVYVTSEEDGTVYVVDALSLTVLKQVRVGPRPRSVVFSRDGTRAYVSAEDGGLVSVIDAQAHESIDEIRMITRWARPMGVALFGARVCVSTGRGGSVECVGQGEDRLAIRDVGARPWGIAIDGDRLYSANGPSNDVTVVDLANGKVLARTAVGLSPWGVAVGR